MKTSSMTWWLVLALSAGTTEQIIAQPGGNASGGGSYSGGAYVSGGGRGSVVLLVTFPEVQQDLGLSEEQRVAIEVVIKKVRDHESKMHEELKNPPPSDPAQWHTQRQNAALKMLAQARLEIARALTPAQMRRLDQISLQELGAAALFRPDVAKALNLSQGQRQKLTQINDQANQQIAASHRLRRPPFGGNPAGGVPFAQGQAAPGGSNASGLARAGAGTSIPKGPGSTREIIQESERRMIEEVLTPQQQAKLKELQGTPCPLKPRYMLRSGGSGGGNGKYGGSGGPIR